MKMNSHTYLKQLEALTFEFLLEVELLQAEPLNNLNFKVDKDTWSVLETLEHLNLYGDFYIPELTKRIEQSKFPSSEIFNSGVLGGYFVNILKPRPKLNTMKTLKDKNPNGSSLNKSVLERFVNQQKQMLEIIKQSQRVNLTKTKTGISISNFIKLRLGDTLGVVVFHNQRHIIQAKNALINSRK